ncbi:MAG: tocopherol cyclase family protein [Anaerolineae bacterium]|jgi:hypothetical protein
MIRGLQRTLHPAWYQGRGKQAPYFEGWYYKLTDSSEQHRLAIIPGIFKSADPGESHAFVQIMDGTSGQATYHEYAVETFRAAERTLDIQVGPNRFTMEQISLHIDAPDRSVIGDLAFAALTPWPVTLTSPGVMGWFAWVPLMQTYHGVLSLDHPIRGTLTVDGKTINFRDGRGYIEKDWGRSFPDAWIWMQTNHFDQPGTSLTASVATIPWLGISFRGFIIGVWHEGALYRFATYTGAQIEKLTIGEDEVDAVIVDRGHRLEITARSAAGGVLRGPTGTDMAGRVPESLRATVMVRLSTRGRDSTHIIFEGSGRNAGLEVVGETSRLLE